VLQLLLLLLLLLRPHLCVLPKLLLKDERMCMGRYRCRCREGCWCWLLFLAPPPLPLLPLLPTRTFSSNLCPHLCVLPKLLLEDAERAWAAHVVRHQLVHLGPDVLARHNLMMKAAAAGTRQLLGKHLVKQRVRAVW
jgi:hypothetical protein